MSDQSPAAETAARYVPINLRYAEAFTCLDCGGLTLDRIIHDQWHHDLADTVAAVVLDAIKEAQSA